MSEIAMVVGSDHPDRDGIRVTWDLGAWLPPGVTFRVAVERNLRLLGYVAPSETGELAYAPVVGRQGATRAARQEWERTDGDRLSELEIARATAAARAIATVLESARV